MSGDGAGSGGPSVGAQGFLALSPVAEVRPPRSLAEGAWVLPGFAHADAEALRAGVAEVVAAAPLRHMVTPGGHTMSVEMSNCGAVGWMSDSAGYRYTARDPVSDAPWPAMPSAFEKLAVSAAAAAGYPGFAPNACLVNRYAAGTKMSLHQDRNEGDVTWPIVSVSLGLPALFLGGGASRSDSPARVPLSHGDVVVWGGPSRLRFHGVRTLTPGKHPTWGPYRVNLTFRVVF